MAEETVQREESVPASKQKATIPPWAIRKVRDDQFSVFVELSGIKVFLASTKTLQEAETVYREKA